MPTAAIQVEVDRIRKMYVERDQNSATREMWAPFAEDEVGYRIQQYISLAELLRSSGRFDLEGLKILDVGCGQGRMLRACLDMGAKPADLFGVDLHENAISKAQELSPNLDFRVSNGTELEFGDGEFDLVMQFVVFSSIFEPELRQQLAKEMMRVLKSGGFLFWWDLHATVNKTESQKLLPADLFPALPIQSLSVGPRPKPSYGLTQRRLLKPVAVYADLFAQPPTHNAALLGPKP